VFGEERSLFNINEHRKQTHNKEIKKKTTVLKQFDPSFGFKRNSMPKRYLRCTISGKVQGVWYRANTQKKALKLGITGWVRNLPDGRVETLIYGDEEALTAMQAWLAKGPPLAKVSHLEVEEIITDEVYVEFKVEDAAP